MPSIEDDVLVTQKGMFEGDEGYIFDILEHKGVSLYRIRFYRPRRKIHQTVELRESEFIVRPRKRVYPDELAPESDG